MLKIRAFQLGEEAQLRALFFNTIRTVNSKDYSEQQVRAWAPEEYDRELWQANMLKREPFVAELEGQIVGYADVQADGYIDHFFCHAGAQGQGVGKALMQVLHDKASIHGCRRLYSHVSISAKGFFEHYAFTTTKQQLIELRSQHLKNFIMEKRL